MYNNIINRDNNIINRDNNINIIIALEKFKKPDKDFIQDKECLICLESLVLEVNKIVKLPCECANSVYHISCIIKLLHSGENKNFCPHCKTIYEIPITHVPVQIQHIFRENLETPENIEQIKNFTRIILFHILLNSLMNIINIIATKNHPDHNINSEIQVAMLFYFCKIFFNYCILLYSKNNISKIDNSLVCSYTFQTVLFCVIIYTLTKIKYDINSIILIVNNILGNFIDLSFRIIVEYKMQNRVNVV
jgi:hypothetical protein